MLIVGVITPVDGSIVSPAVELKIPPVVPTNCTPVDGNEEQTAAGYLIVAVGLALTIMAVVEKLEQSPEPGILYWIVYVPADAPEGLISPVAELTGNPDAGVIENTPPVVPVSITGSGRLGVVAECTTLQITPPCLLQ